jgi:hypothetical protein
VALTIAFLILGCLMGLRFTAAALAWILPLGAGLALAAALAGVTPGDLSTVATAFVAVQFGYFLGCCLGASALARYRLTLRPPPRRG